MLIEDDVLKADNTRYADADLIALTNNGLLYLFSSLKLTLAELEVDHANYPGHATSLLGLVSYSSEYQKGCGPAQGWFTDTSTAAALNNSGFAVHQQFLIRSPDPKGSFQCVIPMKHIFGFMDDYTKVTYRMRDTLQLIRKGDDDSLFCIATAGVGKIVLSNLSRSVPIVQPNDVRKVNLCKSIAANNVILVSFRMRQCETFSLPQARSTVWRLVVSSVPEKPRWVLIGLQTDKSGSQVRNADSDLVALTYNGLLYLFSRLKLTLAGQTVEHVNYPGQATPLLGLASYSSTNILQRMWTGTSWISRYQH